MFSMLLMLLLLGTLVERLGLLVGLVLDGEDGGGGSSDFKLLAGLLANLEKEDG